MFTVESKREISRKFRTGVLVVFLGLLAVGVGAVSTNATNLLNKIFDALNNAPSGQESKTKVDLTALPGLFGPR